MQIGNRIVYLHTSDSTNNYLKENFEEGLVVYAGEQTKGRGQRTKHWKSEAKKNILMSAAITHKLLKAENHFFISKTVSLSVFDFLSEYIDNVKIKWPNDIYVDNKKIAGILIENTLRGVNISHSVIGIGININQDNFPDDLPNPVSLSNISKQAYDIKKLLYLLIEKLNKRYDQLKNKEFNTLSSEYFQHLYRYKEESIFLIKGKKIKAEIINIEKNGRLVLKFSDHSIRSFAFKELEFSV